MKPVPWMIWVDLEGFSYLYDHDEMKALSGLRGLMQDLFRIGRHIYPTAPDRLFIHQTGDGFIVKPDFGDKDLLRPLAIATGLLRTSLIRGCCLKVGVSRGKLADVHGCYPEEVMDNFDGCTTPIGEGLMSIFPVMGDGLIKSYEVSKKASGPILIVSKDLADVVPEGFPHLDYKEHFEVDWIRSKSAEIDRIMIVLNATTPYVLEPTDVGYIMDNSKLTPPQDDLETTRKTKLREYLNQYRSMSNEWRKSAELLIRGYEVSMV